jgi:magnesium-protoporphyrin O-methyltransferase
MNPTHPAYLQRRGEIEHYFDRTAHKTWERLTSTDPVGRIRATVRAGRDEMRATLMSWLPEDMSGLRLLDAGCGTGALALCAAERGAHVLAIDLSANLIQVAQQRYAAFAPLSALEPGAKARGSVEFASGDMLDPELGEFDYVVGMDSLIHYDAPDLIGGIQALSERTKRAILFTFPPRTPLLAVAHRIGRFFPRSDRSPTLAPVSQQRIRQALEKTIVHQGWREGQTSRVSRGFYTSQAWEWVRS